MKKSLLTLKEQIEFWKRLVTEFPCESYKENLIKLEQEYVDEVDKIGRKLHQHKS